MSRPVDNDSLDLVLALLDAAAEAGRVCPSGRDICAAMGWSSTASASKAVAALERRGLIAVERVDSSSRIVTITASGKSTAPNRVAAMRPAHRPGGYAGSTAKARLGAERANLARRLNGLAAGPARRTASGGAARICQWIEGAPSADDACKCGARTARGHSWCPAHLARVYRPAGDPAYGGRAPSKAGGSP